MRGCPGWDRRSCEAEWSFRRHKGREKWASRGGDGSLSAHGTVPRPFPGLKAGPGRQLRVNSKNLRAPQGQRARPYRRRYPAGTIYWTPKLLGEKCGLARRSSEAGCAHCEDVVSVT